jgi:D-sedoheptulose 7-phosphate isomerase
VTNLERIRRNWQEHLETAQRLEGVFSDVERAARMIGDSLLAGGKLLICGNGGSAADAQHIAAELSGQYLKVRRALAAMALHGNSSSLTAIGNDLGYEKIFAREVEAHGRKGDVLLAISTSGNSANILRAVETARELGLATIGLTGASGGKMAPLCELCLCVPSTSTPRIQEMHILIGHTLCEILEAAC